MKSNQFVLTESNYHSRTANLKYFSASQVKGMLSCEARTMAEIFGTWSEEPTVSMLVGSYVDAYFNSKREKDGRGEISGHEFSDFVAENRTKLVNSRTGELKADFRKAEQMIERAESDELFMRFLRGRKQVIMTANLFGVPFKVKYDVLRDHYRVNDKRIVDIKTIRDTEPIYRTGEGKLNFVEYWRYDLQLSIYREVYKKNKGAELPCYLACISKQDPPAILLIHIPPPQLDTNMEYLAEKMERFKAIKSGIIEPERCENCAYCRATRKLSRVINLDELDLDL